MTCSGRTERLISLLWPDGDALDGQQVYAVLDGARDKRIEPMVRFSGLEYEYLFSGRLATRLRAAAPLVVHLSPAARFTRALLDKGWGRSWGFFTQVPWDVTLEQHRRHFKWLLRVADESGRILMFRYYDPRVLRVYLPTCTGDEARQFFGPVPRLLVESEEHDAVRIYLPTETGVRVESASC